MPRWAESTFGGVGASLLARAADVAAAAPRLAQLREAVDSSRDLTWGQWLQLYGLALDFRPALVLDLGRGYGNSTAALTEVANAIGSCRVASVGYDAERLWRTRTAQRLERYVEPHWFDALEVFERNVIEIDLERLIGDAESVFVFWDLEGKATTEYLLAELLPRLAQRRNVVGLHDISDGRYEWGDRAYFRQDGVRTYWHGEFSSQLADWSILHDFMSRNRIAFSSARGSIADARRRDPNCFDEAQRILAGGKASEALDEGHWITFEVPSSGQLEVPPPPRQAGPVGTGAHLVYPSEGEHPVFPLFRRWEGWVDAGWDANWLGVQTRAAYYNINSVLERRYIVAPTLPHDEEYFEWIDLLEAVVAARGEFVMAELGAGWGRWIANAAAAVNQYSGLPFKLIGVEAEPEHFRFLRRHLTDNGIPWRSAQLIQAAVAPVDGTAVFETGASRDYYGQATLETSSQRWRPLRRVSRKRHEGPTPETRKVRAISLETLLRRVDYVDLVDADIQGAEADVFEAARATLERKVKRVHIETHNDEVEPRLRALFEELGWRNIWDYPSASDVETPYGVIHFEGGVQTWVNPRL